MKIAAEYVRRRLEYCAESGEFTWRERPREEFNSDRICRAWNAKHAGKSAGGVDVSTGYRCIGLEGRSLYAHRLAYLYVMGRWPEMQIDHVNQVKTDNRWVNLRQVQSRHNQMNQPVRVDSTSGVTGVYWHKAARKWAASITIQGRAKHLGLFASVDEAATARKRADVKYGFHANHGTKRLVLSKVPRMTEQAAEDAINQMANFA